MTFEFTSTLSQKKNENPNATTINLGKCEKDLKYIYNISEESNLYILKIDIEQKGKNYPLIEYEVFYPLKDELKILNLSFCEGTNIELSIPIIINDTIDKYNPKHNYYNDICYKANSENNVDITLYDRRNNFIKNNMMLCEKNCELIGYDNINKKAKCSCKVKTILVLDNVELDSKILLDNFLDIKKIINIDIIKCYKIVFDINNIKNNYGSFIIIFIFILYLICLNIFYCKSLKYLIDEINKIINALNKKENQLTQNEHNNIKRTINKRYQKSNIKNEYTMRKLKNQKKIIISNKNKKRTNNMKYNKKK